MALAFKMQRHIRILDPVSWMFIFTEAYHELPFFRFAHMFSLLGIILIGLLFVTPVF